MENNQSDQDKQAEKIQPEESVEFSDSGQFDSEDDDDLIELTDLVDPLPSETDDPASDLSDISSSAEPGLDGETSLSIGIPTDEIADSLESNPEQEENDFLQDLHFGDALEEELSQETTPDDDFIESLGVELDGKNGIGIASEESSQSSEATGPNNLVGEDRADFSLTPSQIDAALERVILKLFYDKIETALTQVMGRVVTHEIEKLKKLLADEGVEEE